MPGGGERDRQRGDGDPIDTTGERVIARECRTVARQRKAVEAVGGKRLFVAGILGGQRSCAAQGECFAIRSRQHAIVAEQAGGRVGGAVVGARTGQVEDEGRDVGAAGCRASERVIGDVAAASADTGDVDGDGRADVRVGEVRGTVIERCVITGNHAIDVQVDGRGGCSVIGLVLADRIDGKRLGNDGDPRIAAVKGVVARQGRTVAGQAEAIEPIGRKWLCRAHVLVRKRAHARKRQCLASHAIEYAAVAEQVCIRVRGPVVDAVSTQGEYVRGDVGAGRCRRIERVISGVRAADVDAADRDGNRRAHVGRIEAGVRVRKRQRVAWQGGAAAQHRHCRGGAVVHLVLAGCHDRDRERRDGDPIDAADQRVVAGQCRAVALQREAAEPGAGEGNL